MVNFEWYRTFIAIYQQGTLTKAAQDLLISQPNVSVHLASLEQYVGTKLFERLPRKMVPTETGKKLYAQVVGSVENLISTEQSFTKKALHSLPLVRMGSPVEFFYICVTDRLKHANFQLDVKFDLAKVLLQQLVDGELDVVVASQKTTDHKNIIYEPILTETFVVICNQEIDTGEFNIAIKERNYNAAEEWLLKQDWYAYSNDLAYIRRFWLKNFNKRPQITPKYIIPNLNVIIKAVSESNGISVVSDFLVNGFNAKKNITLLWEGITSASNNLYLAYDKTKVSSQRISEILKIVKRESKH